MRTVVRSTNLRLVMLVLFVANATACTATVHAAPTPSLDAAKVQGVTLKSGRNIPFNPAGVTISANTMYANGPGGQVIIPMDSVQEVWTKQFSTSRTIGLVVGVVAVLGVFFVVANKTAGSGSSNGY